MGKTSFRSDVREHGARTASFSTIAAGALTCDSLVNAGVVTNTGLITATGGISVPATSYIKLGTVYIISGKPTAFTNAGMNALASTALTGVVATKGDIPRGTMILNASLNMTGSTALYTKIALASWSAGFFTNTVMTD